MSGFRFRLEKVLGWYREQCRIEESRLAACLSEVMTAKMAVAALQAERVRIERDIESRSAIAGSEVVAWGLYRLRSRQNELELNLELGRRLKRLSDQRVRLLAARRRLHLLEKLRERRLAEYVDQAEKELERLGADVYLSTWAGEHLARTSHPERPGTAGRGSG